VPDHRQRRFALGRADNERLERPPVGVQRRFWVGHGKGSGQHPLGFDAMVADLVEREASETFDREASPGHDESLPAAMPSR
jgi:hypothetical protein